MGNLFDCRGSRIGCNAFEIARGNSGSHGFLLAVRGSAGKASCHCLLFLVDPGYSFAVKGIPGTIQEGEAAFATTHWTVTANPLSYEATHTRSHFGPAALERTTASTLQSCNDLTTRFLSVLHGFPFVRWTTECISS